MPYAQAGPGEMYYEVRGDAGPWVLYLLGLGSYMVEPTAFRLEDNLSKHARVIMTDTRGVGYSAAHPQPGCTLEDIADDAASVVETLGLPRVHVVGTSMGGMVAQAFAHRHPNLTYSLTLLATCAGWGSDDVVPPNDATIAILENRDRLPAAESTRRGWTTSYTASFIKEHADYLEWRKDAQAERPLNPKVYAAHMKACQAFDSRAWLGEIACPALVVWGTDDQIIPAANSEQLAARIPHARTHVLQGLGHGFPTEAREELSTLLGSFWSGVESEAALTK